MIIETSPFKAMLNCFAFPIEQTILIRSLKPIEFRDGLDCQTYERGSHGNVPEN